MNTVLLRACTLALTALLFAGFALAQPFDVILNVQTVVKFTDAALVGQAGVTPLTESMARLFSTRAQADALLKIANRDLQRSSEVTPCSLYDAIAEFQFPPFHGLVYLNPDGPRIWAIKCGIEQPYIDRDRREQTRFIYTANYVGYLVYRRAVLQGAFNYGLPYGNSIGFFEWAGAAPDNGDGTLVWTDRAMAPTVENLARAMAEATRGWPWWAENRVITSGLLTWAVNPQ